MDRRSLMARTWAGRDRRRVRGRRGVRAVALAASLVLGAIPAAANEPSGTLEENPDGSGELGAGGTVSHPVDPPAVRPAGSLGRWVSSPAGVCWPDGTTYHALGDQPVWQGGPPRPSDTATGVVYVSWLVNPTDGIVATWVQNACLDAPPPPEPPTATEVWQLAPIPAPGVHTSPDTEGLVGLENWFWHQGPTAVSVGPVAVGVWTVSATAQLVAMAWDLGDGQVAIADHLPGTESDPAARAVYRDRGRYQLRSSATWVGTATVSGLGRTFQLDLGSIVTSSSRPYEVIERQAIVVAGT